MPRMSLKRTANTLRKQAMQTQHLEIDCRAVAEAALQAIGIERTDRLRVISQKGDDVSIYGFATGECSRVGEWFQRRVLRPRPDLDPGNQSVRSGHPGVDSNRTARRELVGLTAQRFADDVDAERSDYATTRRVRVGRHGEAVGTLHREDGVIYPLRTGDYPYLSEFAETLP
jgi:hypothetical protein